MELVAGDGGAIPLAVLADGAQQLAHTVVLGHGLADGGVGDVDAVVLRQGLEDVVAALEHVQVEAVFVPLHGNLHVLEEEMLFALAHGLEQLHVLDASVHHGAAVGGDDAVGEIEAALDGPLQQGAAVFAQEAGQVVGGDIHRAGARRTQPDGKGARQVEQRFRRVLTGVGDAHFTLLLGLPDQLVVGFLQEVLKVVQVLQVFQGTSHSFLMTDRWTPVGFAGYYHNDIINFTDCTP